MTHPSESVLALFAGQDLGWFAQWRTRRHVAHCRECRAEVQAFVSLSESLAALDEPPPVSWNRLAAEMRANIRLGLAAGECVGGAPAGRRFPHIASLRALTASVSLMALLAAGLFLQRPTPPAPSAAAASSATLRATANGIEFEQGGQTLSLLNEHADSVTYSAGAQGSMRAGYVDADGQVTIHDVYVQ